MTNPARLKVDELNALFIRALGNAVYWHSDLSSKPLEVDLTPPHVTRFRVYLFNVTYPPGGRTLGERKIQLIIPGQARGQRANLDQSNGRSVLLMGYEPDTEVFVLWDAGTYKDFAYSMNVQVNAETVFSAFAGAIETQERERRSPKKVRETVVCCPFNRLSEAIDLRLRLSLDRLLEA